MNEILWLGLIGGWSAAIWSFKTPVLRFLQRKFLATVEIVNNDVAYDYVVAWLSREIKSTRWLKARTGNKYETGEEELSIEIGVGLHSFRYKGKKILVWLQKESVDSLLEFRETITLQTWGRNLDLIHELIKEAFTEGKKKPGFVRTLRHTKYGDWNIPPSKEGRPVNTLSLTSEQYRKIFEDAERFLKSRDWYKQRGIPWRRGYKLYGPPGCGKTSVALSLATEFGLDLSVLSLKSIDSDAALLQLVNNVPARNIILIEDIDTVQPNRESNQQGITLGGLLNAIDGVSSGEGRILLMTTNYPEKLDPALTRPGRCDVHVEFGPPNHEQIVSMHQRIVNQGKPAALAFAGQNPHFDSVADLQETLLELATSNELEIQKKAS